MPLEEENVALGPRFNSATQPCPPDAAAATSTASSLNESDVAQNRPVSNATQESVFDKIPSYQPHKINIPPGLGLQQQQQPSVFVPQLSNITMSNDLLAYGNDVHMKDESTRDVDGTVPVIVPSYSAWFTLDKVHEIEERAFPEFFPHASSPIKDRNANTERHRPSSEYREIRNFMVNSWRNDPTQHISVTACRRHFAADVNTIIKIHGFLEQWGLINTTISTKGRPALLVPSDTKHYKLLSSTPKGTMPYEPSVFISRPSIHDKGTPLAQQIVPSIDLQLYPNAMQDKCYSSEMDAPSLAKPKPSIYCNTCGLLANDVDTHYYHCLKAPSIQLCKVCFYEGRFSSSFYSGDFVELSFETEEATDAKRTSGKNSSHNDWSDQETLYLLEGIEMYGCDGDSNASDIMQDAWELISKHVGTRNKEECIARFLELPIQDGYLVSSNATGDAGMPFIGSENPVMSMVSWLASMIHPNVAAAAARAALCEYEKLATEGTREKKAEATLRLLEPEVVKNVSSLVLTSSVEKAKELMQLEDSKISSYVSLLVEVYLKKIELKLEKFEALEAVLQAEKVEIEKQRLVLQGEQSKLIHAIADMKAKEVEKHKEINPLRPATSVQQNSVVNEEQSIDLADTEMGLNESERTNPNVDTRLTPYAMSSGDRESEARPSSSYTLL